MTNVWAVWTGRVAGWKGTQQVLLQDSNGQRYVVNVVVQSWMDTVSLVYPTDVTGSRASVPGDSEHESFVAGGKMDAVSAIRDLTQRIRSGTLLTQDEAAEIEAALIDEEIEGFSRYITPTR